MKKSFEEMLASGGNSNSLGKTSEVVEQILNDKARLNELYDCLFNEDAWVRMRAADALEKVCRQQPDWLVPYIDKFSKELATSLQPSIQWHLAQIYSQVDLTTEQKQVAINWLKDLLSTSKVDWIVSANAMDTLVKFTKEGAVSVAEMVSLLKVQQNHKSNAVVKRADKLLNELAQN